MAVFRQLVEARAVLPPLVVSLPPSAWADTWNGKQDVPVDIGLRLISEAEASNARAEAARKARDFHVDPDDEDGRIEAYNGNLMVLALARATCQPDNIAEPYWQVAEDSIARALTPAGIELLYGHLDTLTLAEAPTMPEATDAEIAALARALLDGSAWSGMTGAAGHRVKRLLAVCVDMATMPEIVST